MKWSIMWMYTSKISSHLIECNGFSYHIFKASVAESIQIDMASVYVCWGIDEYGKLLKTVASHGNRQQMDEPYLFKKSLLAYL